ncbi:hypothetical protein CKO31_22560 [Thiohalocapsa halophila]|uniref:LamG domain-containing protein n=1 Tax=Thiohalocapsa halophila TaxID=69359 RepID=A0ABS1CP63_9GAMM|nr:hypothetical protein [Thiohalocapsa halophila]MBK1633478.1 hypothetical protein [Thiohalocapsa halophila]
MTLTARRISLSLSLSGVLLTSAYAAPIPLSGLEYEYKFDDLDFLKSGTLYNSAVETKTGIKPRVNYGNGSVHQGSTVAYDVPNNAGPGFVLRATDQNYGRIPASTSYYPGTDNFTFSVNFRQDTFSSEYASTNTSGKTSYFTPLLSMQGGDFREGAHVGINKLTEEVFWNVQAGAYTESTVTRASAPFAKGLLQKWNNVTAVFNRDQAKAEIWLNGSQVANVDAQSTSPIDSTWDMLLGAYRYSSARG